MQHPTVRFLRHDMLEPLRRWTGMEAPTEEIPIDVTIAAMDAAGVEFGLLSAACVELGVPFCTQVGHTGPLRPSETGRPIPNIDQVPLADLDTLELDDETRDLFLRENTRRVFAL